MVVFLALLTPVVLWLANSSEAKDAVERGDGVTVDAEEDRQKEMAMMNNKNRPPNGNGLAEGWSEAVDFDSGQPYYFNRITREVTWTRPVDTRAAMHKKNDGETPASGQQQQEFDEVSFNEALYQVRAFIHIFLRANL